MLEEFKKFAMRGNVVDLAVGVIIGVAFGAIVNSLVGDIIMPIIGAITGGLDFSNYFTPLSSNVTATALADAKKQGAVLAWGNFLTIVLNFLAPYCLTCEGTDVYIVACTGHHGN
jgi:large conductance mechanosensitive channel